MPKGLLPVPELTTTRGDPEVELGVSVVQGKGAIPCSEGCGARALGRSPSTLVELDPPALQIEIGQALPM